MPKWLHWPNTVFNPDGTFTYCAFSTAELSTFRPAEENLVDNLPPVTTTSQGQWIQSNQWLRMGFTTGNNSSGYTINSVTLRLAEITANPNLFVRLYNDSPGGLGSQITSFTNPSFTLSVTNNYTFTLTNPQKLAANTDYWLVVGTLSASGQHLWAFTTSGNQSGSLGWSIRNDSMLSSNQGGIWQYFAGSVVFQFKVTGT